MRQGVCFRFVFGGLSFGRIFAEFQKMRDEGDLAKFAIVWLCGYFRSRSLQQNVVLCFDFNCFVIKWRWHVR